MQSSYRLQPADRSRGIGVTLLEFLRGNEAEILSNTEAKSLQLQGAGPSSQQLKRGLPIFFDQLLDVLAHAPTVPAESAVDNEGMIKAAYAGDEPAIAMAAGRPYEVEVAKSAGAYGTELQKLGYTLSHVVHGYGSSCQSITELASEKHVPIGAGEFRQLNQCLDTAIAGIAKRAVELNDGTIEVENLPGRGCIFRISLPVTTSAPLPSLGHA
jgi:hypothetical protein